MSLQIKVRLTDTITPDAEKRMHAAQNLRPVLNALGVGLVGLTKRAFNDAALRALPWPPKKDGSPATLKKSTLLWRSVRVTAATNDHVTVGSDRPYAAIHQLGKPFPWRRGQKKGGAFPARPFFPFVGRELTAPAREEIRGIAVKAFDAHCKG